MTTRQLRQQFESFNGPIIQKTQRAAPHSNGFLIWVILVGLFFPPVQVSLGNINFTLGRFVVFLLLIPAAVTLLKSERKRVPSDFFALAFAAWLLASPIFNGGFRPYVGAEALDFLGPYLAGRAFFFGPANLRSFTGTLRVITIVIIALALLDTLSGRRVTLETFGIIATQQQLLDVLNTYRFGTVRASSVFEGAELYGTFCVAAAAIFFYAERGIRRISYVGLSFFGCALSLSSGPLVGLIIVMASVFYDWILKQYAWKWKALTVTVAGLCGLVFLTTKHPLVWFILHLTIDPQTGFFRIGTWDAALPLINASPFFGYGFSDVGDSPFLRSVDCVWLVEALRYGLPAAILLLLTMFSSLVTKKHQPSINSSTHLGTGLSLAIITTGLIGLTVHFWNAEWMFFSLCIGTRASLAEYESRAGEILRNVQRGNQLTVPR